MKLKKVFAGVAAAALAASTCASFSASAAESYNAFLMFADNNWLWQSMAPQASGKGYGVDAEITKDGTYTVSITSESVDKNANGDNPQGKGGTDYASGAVVFCVDITGILNCKNFNAATEKANGITENGTYDEKDIKCKLKSIKQDGKELKFDASKIIYGNIEDQNTNYRIEIYNTYGDTIDTEPIDPLAVQWSSSLEVTFDISGLKSSEATTQAAASTDDTPAATTAAVGGGADSTNTSTNTNTGVETGLALVGLALAGGAIVLTKKRK